MIKMEFKWNSDVFLILSKNGHGKTTLAKNLIKSLGLKKNEVIALDPNNQFGDVAISIIPISHEKKDIDEFCKIIMRYPDHLLVLDDVDVFKQVNYSSEFHSLSVMQRHLHLGLIIISRRIKGLDKTLISNARYIAFSGLLPPEDLKYLKENNIEIDRDLINEKTKQPYYFLIYDQQENEYYLYKTKMME